MVMTLGFWMMTSAETSIAASSASPTRAHPDAVTLSDPSLNSGPRAPVIEAIEATLLPTRNPGTLH